jgi:hypothetical protein
MIPKPIMAHAARRIRTVTHEVFCEASILRLYPHGRGEGSTGRRQVTPERPDSASRGALGILVKVTRFPEESLRPLRFSRSLISCFRLESHGKPLPARDSIWPGQPRNAFVSFSNGRSGSFWDSD